MGRVGACDGWRFLQLYSRLNLKSRPASLHFFALFYLLYFLDVGVWIINLDNLEVWRGLGRGVLRNLPLLKKKPSYPSIHGHFRLVWNWWTHMMNNFREKFRKSFANFAKKNVKKFSQKLKNFFSSLVRCLNEIFA